MRSGRGCVARLAHLGGITLCLERSEESFFGAKDLDGRGGVFAEVGQTACMTDESRADALSEECRQRGSDEVHFFG